MAFPIGHALAEMAVHWSRRHAGLAADWLLPLSIPAPNGHLPARALFLPSPIAPRPPRLALLWEQASR